MEVKRRDAQARHAAVVFRCYFEDFLYLEPDGAKADPISQAALSGAGSPDALFGALGSKP